VEAESASWPDWRDAAAYAPLLEADRSLFAWEWLRRDPHYCEAAERASGVPGGADRSAGQFGLVIFEDPRFAVPHARLHWRSDVHPRVLPGPSDPSQGPRPSAVEGMMGDLKLAKLPDRTPVKVTIHISPDLSQALGAYAKMYAEAYGAAEPMQELIPAMLASFLESDRAFVLRRRQAKSS
jgi:hypothetical protein